MVEGTQFHVHSHDPTTHHYLDNIGLLYKNTADKAIISKPILDLERDDYAAFPEKRFEFCAAPAPSC